MASRVKRPLTPDIADVADAADAAGAAGAADAVDGHVDDHADSSDSSDSASHADNADTVAAAAKQFWPRIYSGSGAGPSASSAASAILELVGDGTGQTWQQVVDAMDKTNYMFQYAFRRALVGPGQGLLRLPLEAQVWLMSRLGYIDSLLNTVGAQDAYLRQIVQEPCHSEQVFNEAVVLGLTPGAISTVNELVADGLARPEWGDRFDRQKRTRLVRVALGQQEISYKVYVGNIIQHVMVTAEEARALCSQRWGIDNRCDPMIEADVCDITAQIPSDVMRHYLPETLAFLQQTVLLDSLQPYLAPAAANSDSNSTA